jgi:hemerythrin superfamily protein
MPTKANSLLGMLKDDHKKVKGLFEEYKDANSRKQKEIADTVIHELEVHAALEEELIYPAIREQIDEDELMNEATEEHHLVHVLIGELKKLDANDEIFTAKFTVLGELIKHHVKEEEGEMFPKAQKADLDWEALNVEVHERKEQLTAKVAARS